MNRCLLMFAFWIWSLVSLAQTSGAVLYVKDTKKNFGLVKQGKVERVEFDFINKGQEPLLINDVKVECSCTTVEYSKAPIAPGLTGKIVLVIDTKTMQDRQDRIAEVLSNASNGSVKLRYKGIVLRP